MFSKILPTVLALVILVSACQQKKEKANEQKLTDELKASGLFTDSSALTNMPTYSSDDAGSSTLYDRAFENAPPLIPHSIIDFVPITTNSNLCLNCHTPKNAKDIGATSIPGTHFTNYRPGLIKENGLVKVDAKQNEVVAISLGENLDMARYNCTECHVPQAKVEVDVENYFTPDFRDTLTKKKSNLQKTMMEGVK